MMKGFLGRVDARAALLCGCLAAVFLSVYYTLLTGQKIFTHDTIIWFGSFDYFVESVAGGVFPLWDPYLMTGTYFYPSISLYGLLDPSVMLCALAVKALHVSPLLLYVYFRLFRLVVFLAGLYLLLRHITKSPAASMLAAGSMLFALIPGYFRSAGIVDIIFLAPYVMFGLIRFLEDPPGSRRFFYLSVAIFGVGMSMNMYIPTYFLFNLAAFCLVFLCMRMADLGAVIRALRGKVLLSFVTGGLLLTLLWMAPPLSIFLKDASGGGELFPMLRISQKNDGYLKQIVATDIGTPSLSHQYTREMGVFSSYGNMVQLIFGDAFDSVPFFANDLMAEVPFYIGIIPLVFAILGALYHSSRYRHVALVMLVLIGVNMFSFQGMSGKPFNAVQKVFNLLFPPLRMVDVREAFGVYFLFYLSFLAALGFSMLFDRAELASLLKRRLKAVLAVCGGLFLAKVVITWFFAGKLVFSSMHDLFLIEQLLVLSVVFIALVKWRLPHALMCGLVVALICADFYVYAGYAERYIVQDSRYYESMVQEGRKARSSGTFDYFREPIGAPPGVAFGESMLGSKGVLTYGNNHALFSTKRYYDVLTHLPLENQLAVSGVFLPIVRVFPEGSATRAADRKQVLRYLSEAGAGDAANVLILEQAGGDARAGSRELGDLGQYPDVRFLHPDPLFRFLDEYMRRYGGLIREARMNQERFLLAPGYTAGVRRFTPNESVIAVNLSEPGFLQYNDGWAKYWEAYDNGRRVPIYIANYNSKAVFLPAGGHEVRFVFNPVHYKVGLALYYAGLTLSCIMILYFYLRSSTAPPGEAAG